MIAGGVRIVPRGGVGVLRRQDDALALAVHELAEETFACAVGVNVGGVDEVAAGFEEGVVDLAALLRGGTPPPILAESHRAEAQFRDPKAAIAEQFVAHVISP